MNWGTLLGFLFWIGFASLWLGIILEGRMQAKVTRLAPSKAKSPIMNMLETISHRRIWREHRRLFPKSRLRVGAGFSLALAAACIFGMIALMLALAFTP